MKKKSQEKVRKRSWKPRNVMWHERTQLFRVKLDVCGRLKLWTGFQVGPELQHQYELQGDIRATAEGRL